MVFSISLRVWSSMLSRLSKIRRAPSTFPSTGILQTFWRDAMPAIIRCPGSKGNDDPLYSSDPGYPTTRAIGYNTQQDGKYDAEVARNWAGARSRSRLAYHLRTTRPPQRAGRGAGQPEKLFQLRLSGSGPGRVRTRPERPQRPRLGRQRTRL